MKNNIIFAAFALILCCNQSTWAQNPYGYGHHRDDDDRYNQSYEQQTNSGYRRNCNSNNNGYNQAYNGHNNLCYNQNNGYRYAAAYTYRQYHRRACNYYPTAPVVYPNRGGYCPPPPMMPRPRVNINIRF
jgi:hypothetical protein